MIEPALTVEEWADLKGPLADATRVLSIGWVAKDGTVTNADRRAVAAACLDGEEYGFTWEDVKTARLGYASAVILARAAQDRGDEESRQEYIALAKRHISTADRLEALLRPEVA